MVHVQLEQRWTDRNGNSHEAGETVDVDPATLATLQARGVASDPDEEGGTESWVGPTDDDGEGTESWVGPTDDDGEGTESWVGPTTDDDA